MKKIVCLAALLLSVLSFSAQAQEEAVKVKASSNNSLRLTLNPSEMSVSTVVFAADTFSRIEMADFGGSSLCGRPDLPVLSKMVEIPVGATVRVNILSENHKTLSGESLGLTHRYLPTQPARRKSDTSAPVLSIDRETYAKNAFFANQLVSIEHAGIARDRNLAILKFSPVQYNPVTNEVVLYDNVEVSLEFEGADIAATQQLKRLHGNMAFGSGIHTINALPATKDMRVNIPIRYTIIAHSSFRGHFDSFVAWKKRQGFMVDVHYTDESGIGTTNTAIASYLLSQYNNATAEMPAPTYVLFVGDHQQIPAFAGRNSMQSDWASSGGRISDLYYFTWTGNDNIPDCYYGRFSAQNVAQLTPQVEKTLYYEQYQFMSPAFLDKALIVAGTDQGYSNDNGYSYADPTMDYIVKTYVNGDHGYSQVHYYKNASSSNPNAPNVTVYSNGGYSASSSSNSVAQAVKNEINEGRGWFNYSAHGNWDELSIPHFGKDQINSLSASNKFGIIIGNCCLTNSFQQSECFGEALLRKQGAGAVAYVGASDYTYWAQDYYWSVGYRSSGYSNPSYSSAHLGCYDRMFHTHSESFDKWATTVGAMMYAGNMAVEEAGGTMAHYYWEVYHLMGDPSLQPWLAQAQNINVEYAATQPFTAQTYDVTAVPYAYVAITRDGEFVTAQFADASGHVSFPMSQLSIGTFELAVTAQGYKPFFRDITIVAGNGPYVLGSHLTAENSPVAGNVVNLSLDLQNVGNQAAATVDVLIDGDPDLVVPIRNHTQAVNLAPDQSFTLQGVLSFLVKADVQDLSQCQFTATITWAGGSDTATSVQSIQLMAPAFASTHVTAPSNANVSGPISLTFATQNSGHADAQNVESRFISGHPAITVANPVTAVGSVAQGQSFTDTYTLQVDASFSGNHAVPFYHVVSDGIRTYADTVVITLSDGTTNGYARAFEDFESGTLAAMDWQNANPGWTITNQGAYAGTYCAKSNNHDQHNSSAELTITYTSTVNDSISFYYKVSSENRYDKFYFYIDGDAMTNASGTSQTSYARASYPVAAGTHEFTFAYEKDGSVSSGDDCAWIDNITLPKSLVQDQYVTDSICAGASYSYQGHSFATEALENGTYHFEAPLAEGGTAFITLHVGIELTVSDDMTIEKGQSVVLRANGASTYEWSDGQTSSAIAVMPSQTTTYTVTGRLGSCSEQASVTITVTASAEGIDAAQSANVDIYPNPAESMVTVSSDYIERVRLINTLGQVLGSYSVKGSRLDIYVGELPSGIYLLQVTGADGTQTLRKLIRK